MCWIEELGIPEALELVVQLELLAAAPVVGEGDDCTFIVTPFRVRFLNAISPTGFSRRPVGFFAHPVVYRRSSQESGTFVFSVGIILLWKEHAQSLPEHLAVVSA
jgi:hypothetical protein